MVRWTFVLQDVFKFLLRVFFFSKKKKKRTWTWCSVDGARGRALSVDAALSRK